MVRKEEARRRGKRGFVVVLSYWTFSPRIGDVGGWIRLWVEHPRASHIQQACCCFGGEGLRLEPKRLAAGLEHKLMVLHMNFVKREAWRM
jgi:hypothetical protein